jgi:hypothetical protein
MIFMDFMIIWKRNGNKNPQYPAEQMLCSAGENIAKNRDEPKGIGSIIIN